MRKKLSILVALSGILLSSVLSVLINSSNVFAASAIDDKYLAKDLLRCYSERLKTEIVPDQVLETEDLLLDEWTVYNWGGDPLDEREPLGALHTTEGGNDELGCIELLDQLGFSATTANVGDVLLKLGYEPQTADGKCITLNFQKYDSENDRYIDYTGKPKLCASSVDSNGVIQGELMGYGAETNEDFTEFGTGFEIYDNEVHLNVGMYDFLYESEYSCGFFWMGLCYNYITYEVGVTKWDDLVNSINTHMVERMDDCGNNMAGMWFYYKGYNSVAGDAGAVSSYKLTDPVTAFTNVGYKNAFGSDYNYDTKLKVTKKEQAVLYQNYLSQYYAVKSDACADTKEASTQAASNLGSTWVQTKVYGADGKPKYCYVTATKHQYDGVYGITGDTTSIVSDGRIYWEDIAAWLLDNGPNSIDTGAVSSDIIDGSGTYTTPTGGSSSSDDETQTNKLEEACYEHAKSLGWVICPMIFGLREVTESIYEWIEPLIRVSDTTVSQLGNQNSNLFKAWNTFRGFANIIFVILFMFIIFSQLTGWGIDNYGIKKMLPKLIITAILVNLSFIICAIAVDASNVIGKGIEGLFEQLGGTIMMKDVSGAEAGNIVSGAVAVSDSVSAQKHIIGEVVSWLVIAAGGIGVGFLIQGWAIIIPILLFLLTVIISIIFAMIILGLRQAIVIILIVLAPVAFACSVLPNTEPIFKKWLSAFKGILVVYPVVGALIGAGYFTSSLIYTGEDSGTGLIMTIVAGLLSVIPYFLIPSLTRKSLDGIGMLGSKIGNIGKGASARTKGAINGAEATKNFRADQAANAKYRRANSKLSRWMDNKSLEAAEKNKGKRGVGAWVANHTIASNGRLRAIKRNDEARVDNARESVMQGAQAARNSMNRMEHGGFAARAANLEDKALEDAIADQTSLWEKDGTFSSDSKFFNEVKSAALGNDDVSKAKLEALMRKAAKGSDKQREILRDAMSAAFKTGGVSSSQAARYGAHLTGNSIYKSNDRSMHDQGTAIMNAVGNGTYGSEGNTSADFANENFVGSGFVKGKQSAESAFSYDDGEFAALAKKMSSINEQLSSGNISAEERTTLENTKQKIAETLGEGIYIKENDPNNKYANVNDHIINEMKKVIEAGYGAEGAKQFIKSDSLKVDHTDATAQADAQQISATQAAQRIQDAARNRTSVPTNVIVDSNGNPLSRA